MTSRRDLLPRMIELSELRERTDAACQEAILFRCDQRQVLEEIQDRLRVAPSLRMEIWAPIRRRLGRDRPKIYEKFAEWFCGPREREIPDDHPSASRPRPARNETTQAEREGLNDGMRRG